jgi:virulence factor Mce-like protein
VITPRTIVNLVAFFAVTLALVAYGVFDLLGTSLQPAVTVSAVFPDASGIAPNLSVVLEGVDVGSVKSVQLVPGGARVVMALEPGVSVPAHVKATIDLANDLGQQQVDLVTYGTPGGQLRNGAVVPAVPDAVPTDVGQVVQSVSRLLAAIPVNDLNTVLSQGAVALAGRSGDLDTIVSASRALSSELLAYQQQFKALLADSPPVLQTLGALGPQLKADLDQTAVLAAVLTSHRYDLVHLLESGASATSVADQLVQSTSPNLACLLNDGAALTSDIGSPPVLGELAQAFATEHWFFGPVAAISPTGPSASLFAGDPSTNDQRWLRTRLYLPPKEPSADQYAAPTQLPPVLPGAGCDTPFGQGVGPATQSVAPLPVAGAHFVPPSATAARVPAPAGTSSGTTKKEP